MSETITLPAELTREMWAAAGDAVVALQVRDIGHHDKITEAVWLAIRPFAIPQAVTPLSADDVRWLSGIIAEQTEYGHCGEGTFEHNARQRANDRIERCLAALPDTVAT